MFRIAIPSRGRLHEPSSKILEQLGCDIRFLKSRKLEIIDQNTNIHIILAHPKDIAYIISAGFADVGITAKNILYEAGLNNELSILSNLGFGQCQIKIAVANESHIKHIKNLHQSKIATSFPNLTKDYLSQHNLEAQLIKLNGATEVSLCLGLADAIVECVETGRTLHENNLRGLATIMNTSAILIAKKNNLKGQEFIDAMSLNGIIMPEL